MHVAYSPEIFRRNPKLGVGLGVILLCIAAGGLAAEYPEYKSLRKSPEDLTVEQAVPSPDAVPDVARWVSLPGGLEPDCAQILQESSNGAVTGTRMLASDPAHLRWFYLRLQGDVGCQAGNAPLVGILRKAVSGLPAWLKDKGMTVPASAFPLMEMSVGETPGDVRFLLFAFLAMGILGGVTTVVFATMERSGR